MSVSIIIDESHSKILRYFDSKFSFNKQVTLKGQFEYTIISESLCNIKIEINQQNTKLLVNEHLVCQRSLISNRLFLTVYSILLLIRRATYYISVNYIDQFNDFSPAMNLMFGEDIYLIGGVVSNPLFDSSIQLRDLDICYENVSPLEDTLDAKFDYRLNRHGSKRYLINGENLTLDFFMTQNVDKGYPTTRMLLNHVDNSINGFAISMKSKSGIGSWQTIKDIYLKKVTLNKSRWVSNKDTNKREFGIMCLRLIRLCRRYGLEVTNKHLAAPKIKYISYVEPEKVYYYTKLNSHNEAQDVLNNIIN